MPTPIDRGTTDTQLQSQVYGYDRTKGATLVEEYKGLSQSKAVALWNGRYMWAQRGQLTLREGRAEMRLEWSGSEGGAAAPTSLTTTIDRWEVSEPNEAKDLFQHPAFMASIYEFTADLEEQMDVIKIIRKHAGSAQNSSSSTTQQAMIDEINTYLDPLDLTTDYDKADFEPWLKFYRLYANNQVTYQDSSWALRHTTNCPANWARNIADTNRNRIYTNAQFLSEVTNGTLWIYPLPTRLQFKLTNAVDRWIADHPARTDFSNGWLKSASPEASVGQGRIEIQTNYRLDQWPTFIYPTAT